MLSTLHLHRTQRGSAGNYAFAMSGFPQPEVAQLADLLAMVVCVCFVCTYARMCEKIYVWAGELLTCLRCVCICVSASVSVCECVCVHVCARAYSRTYPHSRAHRYTQKHRQRHKYTYVCLLGCVQCGIYAQVYSYVCLYVHVRLFMSASLYRVCLCV